MSYVSPSDSHEDKFLFKDAVDELGESAARLERAGIRWIELHGNHYGPDLGYRPQETLAVLNRHHLQVAGVCGMFSAENELASVSAFKRQAAIDYIRRELTFAQAVGAGYLLICPGAVGQPTAYDGSEFERAVQTLQIVADDFVKAGVKGAVEPIRSAETSLCHTVADARRFIAPVDNPGIRHINGDVYHMQVEESPLALERGFETMTVRPDLRPGPVTVFRFYRANCDKLHLAQGRLAGCDRTANLTVKVALSGNRWDFLKECYGNHYVIVAGDIRKELEMHNLFFEGMDDSTIDEVLKVCDKARLTAPMMCFSPDFTNPDARKRYEELEKQKKAIDLSVRLGGKFCRTLSGQNRPGLDRKQAVGWCVEMIGEAVAYAQDKGIVLNIENHYKDGYWEYPEFALKSEVFLEIIEQIESPYLGINFDPSNTIVAGEDPIALLQKIKSRVVTMHASDRYLKGGNIAELRNMEIDPVFG